MASDVVTAAAASVAQSVRPHCSEPLPGSVSALPYGRHSAEFQTLSSTTWEAVLKPFPDLGINVRMKKKKPIYVAIAKRQLRNRSPGSGIITSTLSCGLLMLCARHW